MSNEKQTAMQQLKQYCNNLIQENQSEEHYLFRLALDLISSKIDDELLTLEKPQIVEAFSQGYNSGENKALGIPEKSRKQFESGEQYYSQTYNQ